MTAKSLKWTLAALIVGSPAAMALGLGDIHLHSSLNAPLDADIDLIGATPEDLANLKATMAPRDEFTKNGLDWPAFLSSVTLKPMQTADGRDIIKVHSAQAITEPFVTLLVEINWPRGHVTHEYTVLLDPPVYTPDQGQGAAPVVAAPAVGDATPRGGAIQRAPAAPAEAPAPAPAPAPAARPSAAGANAAAGSAAQTYQVHRGDTLSRIAAHESAGSTTPELRRWMVATYQGNLEAFDKNMNVLRAGSVLRLPDASALGAVSASDALAEVRRQYAAWHSGAAPSAAPSTGTPAATPANEAGRLRLVTPGTSAAGGAGATNGADTKALQGKVQQLQSQLDETQRLLALRNADLARLQAQLASAQSAARANAAPAAAPTPAPTPAPAPAPAPEATPAAPPAVSSAAVEPPPASVPESAETAPPAASAPKHRAHVVPVAVTQNGSPILDTVLKYWWALAALVVALIAFLGLRSWRERRQSSFDDSLSRLNSRTDTATGHDATFDTQPLVPLRDESILVEESGTHARPRLDGAPKPSAPPHIAADQTISAETAVNLDQGDPLAEADFHMAYGLYDQAADLVRIAIQREPTRRDLKLKLLEVFFVWGNKEQFLHSARELADTRAEAAPGEWEKILIMGKQIAPEDPLFAGGSAVSGAAAAGVDLDLEGGQNAGIDFDVLGSPSAVLRAADDIDLDIGTAIGERDPTAEAAAAQATDKNLALNEADAATGSTQEMTAGRMAAARFGGLNEGGTVESPTIDQQLGATTNASTATVREKVDKALQQTPHAEQTAELAIDDLGLDLNSLDTVDQPALGSGADAPTMVAGLDEHSRRLLETAEHRSPEFEADPGATGAWQFDGAATDTPGDAAAAPPEHDVGATTSLQALSNDLDFNLGLPEAPPPADTARHNGLDLDVGTATIPDTAFTQTQKLGTEDLALPDLEPVTMSEVGTKLDLARAYMDMGDPEGARNILEEVVSEGSVAQKQEAQRLIESLPG
ncbi:MAG TPA: FimV/HubP family polar landmark protein [Steroidobacteraceae bacterium]|nr:FimV/HubP family polar landmark protein [Steroidobacteraceae bacterium]